MMNLIARVPSNVSSSTSVSPEKRSMEIKIPGGRMLRKRQDRGDPLSAATERPHLTIIMNNLLTVLPQQASQSGMITILGLLKSGKLILRCANDRCDPLSFLGERHENPNQFSLTRKISTMEPRNPL